MVLWCKFCGAFVGLRPPLTDWTVNAEGLCPSCVAKQPAIEKDVEKVPEKDGSESDERKLITT